MGFLIPFVELDDDHWEKFNTEVRVVKSSVAKERKSEKSTDFVFSD